MQSPEMPAGSGVVADAQRGNWVDRFAPEWLKPYARLARWDRPIGFWLLFWPCGFSLALAAVRLPAHGFDWWALLLCFVGAIAMRGAGCTFNDLVDTDIDMKVARTRSRPIPSGQVSKTNAVLFLVAQALVGLLVLIQFNQLTIIARRRVAAADRDLSVHEARDVVAAALPRAGVLVGRAARMERRGRSRSDRRRSRSMSAASSG